MKHLNCEFDCRVWVKEWMETLRLHPNLPWDEGAMIGWFANAIMAGFDEASRRNNAEKENKMRSKLPKKPFSQVKLDEEK